MNDTEHTDPVTDTGSSDIGLVEDDEGLPDFAATGNDAPHDAEAVEDVPPTPKNDEANP